jgi:small subunit ribosomal protein S6
MTDQHMNTYEGLFLFPQSVAVNLQAAIEHLQQILDRSGAEILALRKWDERKLAFDIRGNRRGTYFLAYFKAATDRMPGLERDCNLSEQLLRSMVIRADHVPAEQIEASDNRRQLADEVRVRAEARTESAQPAEGGPPRDAAVEAGTASG